MNLTVSHLNQRIPDAETRRRPKRMRIGVSNRLAVALVVGLLMAPTACREAPRSAAADVSKEDVRRLPPSRKSVPDVMVQAADRGRVLGAQTAALQILVVSDFQCTDCRRWFEATLPVLQRDYVEPGRVRLIWVHYPLREHPNAVVAANAAMCASAQGRFWEASARIFATPEPWGSLPDAAAVLDSLATVPGVDSQALRDCTRTKRMLRQIRADIDWADKAGLGTPLTMQVGTRRIPGITPLPTLRAAIDSALISAVVAK